MESLTKAEERVMQILWKLKKGFVKDIIEKMPMPTPPYNTISSIVRILEKKGFVSYTAYGKTYEYYPLISKTDYKTHSFKDFLHNYFDNSYQKMVSFMVEDNNLSEKETQEIKKIIDKMNK